MEFAKDPIFQFGYVVLLQESQTSLRLKVYIYSKPVNILKKLLNFVHIYMH